MYLATVSFRGLLPSEARKIEKYLREDFSNRCSVRYDFPRGKFSPGFTNCTLLTSSEKVGLIFSLYLALASKRIADIFQESIVRQQGKYLDLECCYANLGYSQSSESRQCKRKLPRIGDKYFFSDLKNKKLAERAGRVSVGYELPRNLTSVKKIVDVLDAVDLLFVLQGKVPLDELQSEYLPQSVWFRVARKDQELPTHDVSSLPIDLDIASGVRSTVESKEQIARQLVATLRKGMPPLTSNQLKLDGKASSSKGDKRTQSSVQKRIKKHFIDKPKIKGRGET
jgi:hypothetical protein